MPRGDNERKAVWAAFRCGDWLVEPELTRISCQGKCVNLEGKVMDVLVVLARYAPRMVSRIVLIDAVWDGGCVTDNTLTQSISQLRRAFDDDAKNPEYIETIHRKGYRLLKPISSATTPPEWTGAHNQSAQRWLIVGNRRVSLNDGANLIGRSPQAAVPIDSLCVSRHHARIIVNRNSAVLEDLESKNGTHLNGRRIVSASVLEDGDEILLGDHSAVLRFSTTNQTETPSEPLDLTTSTDPIQL